MLAGIWGPHLVVVPTSVMLNWEMELKKWCPGFKILTYYGSVKERKLKRVVSVLCLVSLSAISEGFIVYHIELRVIVCSFIA